MEREDQIMPCRIQIASYCSQFITPLSTTLINGSLLALDALIYVDPLIPYTLITNNVTAALLPSYEARTILLLGGKVKESVLTGPITLRELKEIEADRCLIGCAQIDPNGMITTGSKEEDQVVQEMIERSSQGFLLAEFTKFVKEPLASGVVWPKSFPIVTDPITDPKQVEQLKKNGYTLLIVGE